MQMKDHGSWSHGLRPGTVRDMNCGACQTELREMSERAAAALQAELQANAPAIAAVLDSLDSDDAS